MSNKVTIKDKKYRLPRGWQLMTPEWLSRLSGIPLEELVPEEEQLQAEQDANAEFEAQKGLDEAEAEARDRAEEEEAERNLAFGPNRFDPDEEDRDDGHPEEEMSENHPDELLFWIPCRWCPRCEGERIFSLDGKMCLACGAIRHDPFKPAKISLAPTLEVPKGAAE